MPEPEADRDDIRKIIYQGYRIIYRRAHDYLLIVTVLQGCRDLRGAGQKTLGRELVRA